MSQVLFALGYVALILGVLFLHVYVRRRSRQERAPFPENTRLLRGPGESLRRKVAELDEAMLNEFLVACVAPASAIAVFFYLAGALGGAAGLAVAGLGVAALVITLYFCARRFGAVVDRRRNTVLGAFGERIVAEHLEPLKAAGHFVFHDVPAGDPPAGSKAAPFNLDHVVVGPAGVFAIETKTRRKGRARVGFMAHEIIYDGRALAYPWGEDRHGLEQARRQAEWLANFLQQQLGRAVPVQALLVFPGWMILRKGRGAVNVLNPKELPAAIAPAADRPAALDADTVDLIARQLEARCRDVEL